jgi:hypothetical protein
MKSNLDNLKKRSNYHFDPFKTDPAYDTMKYVGRFEGDWSKELEETIKRSKTVTLRTRNPDDKSVYTNQGTSVDIVAEEYDVDRAGGDPDHPIVNLDYELLPIFQKMADTFKLVPGEREIQSRVHVQHQGQVWPLHIDKVQRWKPDDIDSIFRFFVMLEDWQPGHFMQFGNHFLSGYRAGEIYTFDWYNVPHCTANAGLGPRSNLLITGVASEETLKLLAKPNNVIKI